MKLCEIGIYIRKMYGRIVVVFIRYLLLSWFWWVEGVCLFFWGKLDINVKGYLVDRNFIIIKGK